MANFYEGCSSAVVSDERCGGVFVYIADYFDCIQRGSLSSMRANLAWSMKSKALWKSMYDRHMSLLVSNVSSRVAIIIWICLEMLCRGLNLS